MASKKISSRSVRENLKDVMKRYYTLLGHDVKDHDKILEVKLPRAKVQYVYDRKSAAKYPKAEMITFNSEILSDILADIQGRGRVAKAFIPFEFSPEESFKMAMEKLLTVIDATKYVANGSIEFLSQHIKYVPFLMFIMKIEFSALESMVEIEREILPLLEESKLDELDKLHLSSLGVDDYINRLNSYFDSPDPNLVNEMPVQGDLHEISEKEILAISDNAIDKIKDRIEYRVKETKKKLGSQLDKELGIINKYYNQRIDELERSLYNAEERDDDEDVKELRDEIKQVKAEKDFKNSEYENAYQVDIQYNVLGATIVYIPMIFYYKSLIISRSGTLEKEFNYNFFDNELIPPLCPECEKPIKQGVVCSNNHFVCINHSYNCDTCGKHICKECGMQYCKICNRVLCKDHSFTCEQCEKKGRKSTSVCNIHHATCEICGTSLCEECTTQCMECNRTVCEECSARCKICGQTICKEHTYLCDHCKETGRKNIAVCKDHHHSCSACGASLCYDCSTTCVDCQKTICLNNEECTALCRICNQFICKEHAYTCDHCKQVGERNTSTCKAHHVNCIKCGTSLCADCSVYCANCGQPICVHNEECSTRCHVCNQLVCNEHISLCTIDDKKTCKDDTHECTICHQVYCTDHIKDKRNITCHTCHDTKKEHFYNFIRHENRKMILPSFLKKSKKQKDTRITEITIGRRTYKVPANQQHITMGQNKHFYIFHIKKPFETYCIVYNKENGEQTIYYKTGLIGTIQNFLKNVKPERKIVPDKPIVIIEEL